MPASLGLKLAAGPHRTVVNVIGDGSALFYPHTWWTSRKLDIPVLYVIINNHAYRTLQLGLQAIGDVYNWFPSGDPWYLELHKPQMSFAALAAPFEVSGTCATYLGELEDRLREGLKHVEAGHPFVVDVQVEPVASAAPPSFANIHMTSRENADDRATRRSDLLGAP
jgi:benzoylformate decarboxylase